MTVDVWMQHPTLRFSGHEMFASLRRWTGGAIPSEEIPIDATVAAMDAAGVMSGCSARGTHPGTGALISNDEVAAWVSQHPDRFAGLAAVDLDRPMTAVRDAAPLRDRARFRGAAGHPVAVGGTPD